MRISAETRKWRAKQKKERKEKIQKMTQCYKLMRECSLFVRDINKRSRAFSEGIDALAAQLLSDKAK